jgi:hypothetical protein
VGIGERLFERRRVVLRQGIKTRLPDDVSRLREIIDWC